LQHVEAVFYQKWLHDEQREPAQQQGPVPVLHGGNVWERRKLAGIALVKSPHHKGEEKQDEKPGVAAGQVGGSVGFIAQRKRVE